MKNHSNYIPSLTPLRGIAALLVFFFHYNESLTFVGLSRFFDPNISGFVHNGYMWVDFFFILSGFIICHVYGKKLDIRNWEIVKKYLWVRFSRLYPLHLFMMIMFTIMLALLFYFFPNYSDNNWWVQNSTLSNFVTHLFFLQTTGITDTFSWNIPSWSIAAEWWTYILAIIFIPFLNKIGFRKTIFFIIISLLGLVIINISEGTLNVVFALGTLRCLFGFIIGVGVYQAYKTYNKRVSIWSKDLTFFIVVICCFLILHFNTYNVLVIPFFAMLILCASLNRGIPHKVLNTKPLLFLGDISYSIYLVHVFWILIWSVFLELYLIKNNTDFSPTILDHMTWLSLLLNVTILTSYMTYSLVEVPAQKRLRKLIQNKSLRNKNTHQERLA